MNKQKKLRGPYGQNMIKVSIRFWTNNLPKGTDSKTAHDSGAIYIYKNEHKGIKPSMTHFKDINIDFLPKLFKLLKKEDIKLIKTNSFDVVNK